MDISEENYPTEELAVFLVFKNQIDFQDVYGTLGQARNAIPQHYRHLRQANPRIVEDGIEDYVHYHIRRKIITILYQGAYAP